MDNFEQDVVDLREKLLWKARSFFKGDNFAAEDLVQNVMVKMLTNRDKFEPGTNLSSWGYFILKNEFINEYRSNIRHGVDFELDSDRCSNVQTVAADVDIRANDILKLIDKLGPEYKQCFTLHLEGFKYDEIAEQMEVPIGTIKSRIFLARKILKEKINLDDFKCTEIITTEKDYVYEDEPKYEETEYKNLNTENMKTYIDLTQNLKIVLKEIFERSNNEWIDNKDFPLGKFYLKNGFDNNWSEIINKYLKTSKFFGIKGENRILSFRSYNAIEPDYDVLAKEVIKFREDNDDTFRTKLKTKTLTKKEQIEKEANTIRIPKIKCQREFEEKQEEEKIEREFGEVRKPVKSSYIVEEKVVHKEEKIFPVEEKQKTYVEFEQEHNHKEFVKQFEKETQNKTEQNIEENFVSEQQTYREFKTDNTTGLEIEIGLKINKEKLSKIEEKISKKVRTHFNVDDVCYAIFSGSIMEFNVSLVQRKGSVYLHNLENEKHDAILYDVVICDIFETPEQLTYSLINNCIFLN